jgi:hypothetical protein
MLRRFAALALLVTLTSGSVTICPTGGCPLIQVTGNDCCTKGPGIKRIDCCPGTAERGAPWLASAPHLERLGTPQTWLAAPGGRLPELTAPAEATFASSSARGPSPPASLFTQQTSLLL